MPCLASKAPQPEHLASAPPERVESASVDAGALAVYVAKPDDTHHILLLMFGLPKDGDRVSREVRGPWMGQSIVPFSGATRNAASASRSPRLRPEA